MILAGLSLRDLEYVVAVAELRHFGRAAERCAVSQPSLSAQVRKLEEQLGVALFERTSRKVLLTPCGEAIVSQARVVLDEARRLLALADGSDGGLVGRLRLAAIHTLGPYLFPHVLPPLRARWPDLTLILSEGRTDGLLEELRDGRLDAVLLALPVEGEGLTAEALFFEPFLLAHSAGHRLCGAPGLNLNDLDPSELLLLEEGHCLRDQALAACGLTARGGGVHATGLETLRHMVAAGAGCTLMPLLATRTAGGGAADVGGLVAYRGFDGDPPGRTIGLAWRASDPRARGLADLAGLLRGRLPAGTAAA
ncbi:LysR substrate-binding domain-containing protein [Azospirillum picis]|uniref:LysR family hydrogen peroxide-inducible transcriptional activator n=1 Tax=Azospirillum picis TaxID=488438 RepID=A0ABU0MUA1_9PROT|nr:LysR substrate-binding domain-containing protein [Azospirillum picis]MBP2299147.1 LysR family hydrogen peroxide-inducible transcriptional activator [Azospirillum picis]MDQ0537073.1 LysR family hydrogen peroxide-inducible transcriptional activator [Azospirillum picis]